MYRAIPEIRESVDELQRMLKQERRHACQQRLHALYLLASKQAHQRREVAALLGVNRNTVGRWLHHYRRGGIDTLLAVYIPPGKRKPLTPDQLAKFQCALERPQGFASYDEVRHWIATTFDVELTYNAVHKLVRYKLRAKLKVPRPSHIKKSLAPSTRSGRRLPINSGPPCPSVFTVPSRSGRMMRAALAYTQFDDVALRPMASNPSAASSSVSTTSICTAWSRPNAATHSFSGCRS